MTGWADGWAGALTVRYDSGKIMGNVTLGCELAKGFYGGNPDKIYRKFFVGNVHKMSKELFAKRVGLQEEQDEGEPGE